MNIQEWLRQTADARRACSWADIITIQRVLLDESITHVKTWTGRKKAVIIDFDDAYQFIRDDNAAFPFWGEGKVDVMLADGHKYKRELDSHPVKQFADGLRFATAIATPSKVLGNDWQRYVPSYYIPNYLDLDRYHNPQYSKYHNEDNIVIGWGGSLSHVPSFKGSGIAAALNQLISERPHVKFLLVGDKRIKEELSIPESNFLFNNYVKFNDWPRILHRYDIGVAPIFDRYDCRRSHLKVMEYIAMGIPFVATKSAVYEEFFDAQSGYYVDQGPFDVCANANPQQWYEYLLQIVDGIEEYRRIALKEKERYREVYDSDMNVDNTIAVYKEILKNV